MLYKTLPDAYFEAQRQKEQLLIDRATQYKTAIKRFVTKNQTYPTSLDQLDNFNGVRYLRHHYKDPMTGKTEWRLIHIMSPGFVLTDSKVTPMNANGTPGQNGATTPNGNNQGGFGSTSSTFGSTGSTSSTFGTSNSTSSSSSFGSSGAFGQSTSSFSNQSEADSNTPPGPSAAQLYGARRRPPAIPSTSMEGQQSEDNSGQPDTDKPLPEPGTPGAQQIQNGAPSAGDGAGLAGNGAAQQANGAGGPPGSDPNNPAANALNSVNNALRQQQPKPSTFASSSSSSGPTISNGSIAGVASTAKGSSIKIINKQTDYSKWEFVYNPQQDAANQAQSALGNNNANRQNPNGQNPNNNNNTGFGSSNSTNSPGGFGSTTGGGFGSSNSTSNSTNTNSSSFGNH